MYVISGFTSVVFERAYGIVIILGEGVLKVAEIVEFHAFTGILELYG